MSRFTASIPGKNLEIAWGYDNPMKEYFIQAFLAKKDEAEDEDLCVFSVSSISTLKPHPNHPYKLQYSNAEIMEIMQEYEEHIPADHIQCVALDLPF